jgi:hypothetical protein
MFDRTVLQTGYTSPLRRPSGSVPVVILMLGLWLGLVGLSASEQLHRLVHSDSHQVNHECLLTLFAKGSFSPSSGPPQMSAPVFEPITLPPLASRDFPSTADIRLAPGRAPPVVSLLHQ